VARMADSDLVTLGPWPRGANNYAREDSVPRSSFREGVNVDVYPGGKVRRRPGSTVVDGTPVRNLWSDGSYALCTSDSGADLLRVRPGQPLQTIYSGLRADSDIAYASVNHLVYVSDGAIALRVGTADDSVRPWGIETPAAQPVLLPTSGGLDPGAYQVAITFATHDGEESGTGQAATIDLPDGGGITAMFPAPPSYAPNINLYVSRANGGEFRLYGTYPAGETGTVIGKQPLGRPLRTFGLEPMPAGSAAALVGGLFVVASGALLVWSDALNYGLTNPAKNYVPYPGAIDLLAPTALGAQAAGIFVAAGERTYFLANDVANSNQRLAYADGAQRGAPIYINGSDFGIDGFPDVPLPMWVSKRGAPCVGLPDGSVKALTEGRFALPYGDYVSIAQRDLHGVNQIVASLRSPVASSAACGDSADTVLVRNGVVLP